MKSKRRRKNKKKNRRLEKINKINIIESKNEMKLENENLDDYDEKNIKISDNDYSYNKNNDSNNKIIKYCEAKIIETKILNNNPNKYICPKGKKGNFIIKVPVVLSEMELQIDCSANIDFIEPVGEIKRVYSNTYITKNKILTESKRLFLSGFIRQSIEYTVYNNKMKNIVINIPFESTSDIKYCVLPDIDILHRDKKENIYNVESDLDNNEIVFNNIEFYNENIYCEPVKTESKVLMIKKIKNENNRQDFSKMIQYITINLTIKILQQQIIDLDFKVPK